MGGAEAPTYHRKQNGFGNVPVGKPKPERRERENADAR
jgi:hypothetical protein